MVIERYFVDQGRGVLAPVDRYSPHALGWIFYSCFGGKLVVK
jgi:hypothetical protein